MWGLLLQFLLIALQNRGMIVFIQQTEWKANREDKYNYKGICLKQINDLTQHGSK